MQVDNALSNCLYPKNVLSLQGNYIQKILQYLTSRYDILFILIEIVVTLQ